MKAVVVPVEIDQPVAVVDVPDPRLDPGANIDAVSKLVGADLGDLDGAILGRGLRAWVDDMGYYRLPVNGRATGLRDRLASEVGVDPGRYQIGLYGTVVLLGPVVGEDESEAPQWLTDLVESGRFDEFAGVAS